MSSFARTAGPTGRPLLPARAPSPRLAAGVLAVGLGIGTLVAVVPSPLIVVALVLGLTGVALAFFHPGEALMCGIVAIPLDAFVPGGAPLGQVVLLVAAMGAGARWIGTRPLSIAPSLVGAGLLVLVLASAVGMLFAPHPDYPLTQAIHWASFLVLFQYVVNQQSSRLTRRLLVAVAVSAGMAGLTATLGIGANAIDPSGTGRAVANFGSPNGLGIYLALALPVQAMLVRHGSVLVRTVAAGCFVFSAYGLLLTSSRSAFLGTVAGFMVLGLWSTFRRFAAIGICLLVALTLSSGGPLTVGQGPVGKLTDRLTSSPQTATTDPRAEVYKVAPQMFLDHPVLGIGALEFGTYSGRYGLPISGGVVTHAHDIALTIAIELGVFGLVGLLLAAFGVARDLGRAVREAVGAQRAALLAVSSSFTALAVEGLIDYPLTNSNIAAVIAILAACAVTLARAGAPGAAADTRLETTT